ncbi:MAG: NAD-dependent epimerase/dehydratase family protein [Candidatus Riflebacteria bacterium]|nr:NAD-dependent epimerase/dehydratase family protein [Candidatus Riflebacteria bacterium]
MENPHPRILITGVNGFVGHSVAPFFAQRGYEVIGAGRRELKCEGVRAVAVSRIDRYTHWGDALADVDVVIHLAGRAHKMNESPVDHHLYYETNVEGTVNLAEQAVKAGVKKFVFISSIKAMFSGACEEPLVESLPCRPHEPYGISKLKAEYELQKLSEKTYMKLIILRPPLIYGPGVKGNLSSLIKIIRHLPLLPFGGITNRRSLLGVKNLASAIDAVIQSDQADNKTFLVADGEDISTSELVKRLAEVFNPSARLIDLPGWLWHLANNLPLLSEKISRLTGSLTVNAAFLTQVTGWRAPFSMIEQLKN